MQKKSKLQEAKNSHPIIFVLVLFIITLLISGLFSAFVDIFIQDIKISGAIARIVTGVFIILLFYNKSNFKYSFGGFKFMLPLLLLGLYKIPLCIYTKGEISDNTGSYMVMILLLVLLILESLYGVWLAKRADKLYDE